MIHSALRIDIHNDALVIYWRLVFVAFFFKTVVKKQGKIDQSNCKKLYLKNIIWKAEREKVWTNFPSADSFLKRLRQLTLSQSETSSQVLRSGVMWVASTQVFEPLSAAS